MIPGTVDAAPAASAVPENVSKTLFFHEFWVLVFFVSTKNYYPFVD